MVISIIALLMGILLPALGKARRAAKRIIGMNNQRNIVDAVLLYASDGDERYPESVATLGPSHDWNWHEPMKMVGHISRSPAISLSMSAYLRRYIKKGKVMHCPGAPHKPKYLEKLWAEGDGWLHPDMPVPSGNAFSGTYCFYWSYEGYLEDGRGLFLGPRTSTGGRGRSTLLVSEYFGYGYYGSRTEYGSCEEFKGATQVSSGIRYSGYWAGQSVSDSKPEIKLSAGYVDGHIESYSSLDTASMLVINDPETGEPYPEGIGPGKFFLPLNALH